MKRIAFLSLVISSVFLVLGSAQGRTRPRQGGTFRMETQADASQWMYSSVRTLVFDSLTEMDDVGRVQPALAIRWESQSDDRRWQISLRPGLRFHDGTPVSAATVVQSLTAQDCAGCPWRSVHVSGDSIVFEAETPVPQLPALLANTRYAIVRRDENGNLVGTGAFRYSGLTNGIASFTAVDDGWHSRAFVNSIELRGGRSLRDQWMDVAAGRADFVEVPAEQLRRAQQEKLRLLTSRDVDLIALAVDDRDPATQDVRLREALALSVDRASLLNVVFQKQGELAASVLPNWLSGYSFAFAATPNLAKAKELRAQTERPSDLNMSVNSADPLLQLIGDRIALNARDAGLVVRPVTKGARAPLRLVRLHVQETTPASAYVSIVGQLSPGERAPADDVSAVFQREQELAAKHTVIPLVYVPRAFAYSARVHELSLAADGTLRVPDFWLEDAR